jgi:hypothetical protein
VKRVTTILIVLLALPVFLFIYQPAWQLGGLGLVLGGIGITLTPLAILYLLYYYVRREW